MGQAVQQPGMVLRTRYELIEPIAAGGMAQVWRGVDRSLNRPVAVKILHSHLAVDQGFVTRFRREALAAAKLSHSSIVAVYDTVSEQGLEAIVMELVVGRTLRSVLDEVGVLPAADVVDVGVQISEALDVAHRAGIVHRDIKPANIMVGNDRRIMVTDFGIAKATKDDDLTQTGTMLGTAKYLAPEQVTGDPIDPRADIYALGVVLFEAATGRPPFQEETDAATALARLRLETPRCRDHRGDVPIPLDEAIARAMAREPAHRHDRASTLRAELAGLDLTQVGPVPADLANLPPPTGLADAGMEPPPPRHAGTGPVPTVPPSTVPPSNTSTPSRPTAGGRRQEKKPVGGRRQEKKLAGGRRQQKKLAGGRQRPTRAIAATLIVGALLVAVLLLSSLGGDGPTIAAADRLPIADAVPFDPEGTPPHDERNELAPLAIDGDRDTFWRTDGYAGPDLAGLKSGVGLVLHLGERRTLEAIEVDVGSSDHWEIEVYVGDGDFGPNGEDFDPDRAGGPVTVLDAGGASSATLDGASGSHVLLWITQTGIFEHPSWGVHPHRFVLREVRLA